MRQFLSDAVYGCRLFRRNWGSSLLAVWIIALGIGSTTAIFSLIDGILLNPLPYREPDRLALIWSDFSRFGGNRKAFSAAADYFDWKERSTSFQDMAAYYNTNRTFTALDQPLTPLTHEVTANFFDVVGVRALRGRTFLKGEDVPGHDQVAIISYSLWRAAFGGAESVMGSKVELDGRTATIVGILPPDFRIVNNAINVQPDLWVPNSFESQRQERKQRPLVVVGRLRSGALLGQARAELAAVSEQISRQNAADVTPHTVAVNAIRDELTADFRGTFLLLQGAVAIMMLIACANITNLLLVRYAARGREFALRIALGASRAQIVSHLLTESLLLSLAGGTLGVVLAKFSLAPILALVPGSAGLPFADQVDVSLRAAAFAFTLSTATSVLFGLAPARQAFRSGLAAGLNETSRGGTAGRRSAVWRNVLIASEVGLSLLLVASAGLMIQTFWKLQHRPWGFEPAHVLTLRNSLRGESYASPAARRNHFAMAAARLGEIAGVESATAVSFPPPLAPIAPVRFVPGGSVDPGRDCTAFILSVLPRYFETLRTPILSGRAITEADTADTARVAVISQALARRYFTDTPAVGQSLRVIDRLQGEWRIVGIAADVQGAGLADEAQPVIYFPHAQAPDSVMTFVLRTRGDPMAVAPAAERTLWQLGRMMNVYATFPMEQRLTENFWQSRFTMALLTIFAALALSLAAGGVYAVMSLVTAQRTREIGIRTAVGASAANVVRTVVWQGARPAAIGIACGLAGSLAFGRALSSRLYGVSASDPFTLAAASAILMLVAVGACMVPAMRAARIDPLRALREG